MRLIPNPIHNPLSRVPSIPLAWIMTLALACFSPAQAQWTWQTTHTTVGGFDQGIASIVRNELFVTAHPGYLDVEEEVEIGTSGTVNAGNDALTLEINGTFTLPPTATVVGLLLWDGEKVLQAKLLSKDKADSLYQEQVDRNSTPPVRPRDPIILSLDSPGNYRFSIYPVKLNESRRFRLRYHLPPTLGADGLSIPLQAAFAKTMGDEKVQVHVSGSEKVDSITWLVEGLPRQLGLPRNLFVTGNQILGRPEWQEYTSARTGYWELITHPAIPGIEIRPIDPLYQALYATSLPAGQMQGEYMHLYSQVPQEAFDKSGMRVEIVILWKWHGLFTWTAPDKFGYADLAPIYQADNQARQIEGIYDLLRPQGASIGLVHADGRHETKNFAMAGKNDDAFAQAKDYLAQWNFNSIHALAEKARAEFKPKSSTVAQRSKDAVTDFTKDIRLVRSLYSPQGGVVRHLLLVSAGPAADLKDMSDLNALLLEEFKEMPLSIGQIANSDYQYPGFDLAKAKRDFPLGPQRFPNFLADLPSLPDFTTTATLRNGKSAFDLDLKCLGGLGVSCDNLVWHGKSATPWKPEIEWQVHDGQGKYLASHVQTPKTFASENDTALAVLWAGSEFPFSENREPPLGAVYGFVDASSSLLALEKDSLATTDGEILPNGSVPRIVNNDILDVIPNYNANTPPGQGVAIMAPLHALNNPRAWRIAFLSRAEIQITVPGLQGWTGSLHFRLLSLDGRQVEEWTVKPDAWGRFTLRTTGMHSGLHLLSLEGQSMALTRRLILP